MSAIPTTPAPSTSAQSAAPPHGRSPAKLVIAILLVIGTVAGVGYYAYVKLGKDASSPAELVARFGEAGVTCAKQKSLDLGETKSIWCGTLDGTAITTTTYSNAVSYQTWLSTHCSIAGNRGVSGAAIVSEKWIIDVQRLVTQRPTATRVADRLAKVLGGEVKTFTCPAP